MREDGTGKPKDGWKPSVEILDSTSGKTVAALQLTTDDEDRSLAAARRISHFEITALAFSLDGSRLAVGTSVGQAKLFDARSGRLVRSLDDEEAKLADKDAPAEWKSLARAMGSVAALAFSPNGAQLVTGGESFGDFGGRFDGVERLGLRTTGPGRLKLWDLQSGKFVDLIGHSHVSAVAFSADGSLLASAGNWLNVEGQPRQFDDGTGAILWNPQTGTKASTLSIEANGGAQAVAFSPDGTLLAISSLNFDKTKEEEHGKGLITLLHIASGIAEWERPLPTLARPLAFLPGDTSLITLCDGQLWFLNAKKGTPQTILNPGDAAGLGAKWVDFSLAKDGHMQAMGGMDRGKKGTIYVLDPDTPTADAAGQTHARE